MDTMLHISTLHYLVIGAALFILGVIGVLTRRNVVVILMSIELILNAVNLNLVAFSRYWQGMHGGAALHGQIFAIFVITDAAAEAAVGLGILIAFFRNKETVNVDEVNLLKW
jgi:NADH-quinone oxidoreductase subunit K